jgi:hypothetical protein
MKLWLYLENGGRAIFITTSRRNNHLKRPFDYAPASPEWFTQLMPTDKSPVFIAQKLEELRKEMIGTFGEALFNQKYFCSFKGAQPGAYYAKAMALARSEASITDAPWTAGPEVYTFWDLGVDDSTTLFSHCQLSNDLLQKTK